MTEAADFHFTYGPADVQNLSQGDLVAKTSAVQALLREVHPHYTKDDYTHLFVLTQSCDLVRRGSAPCNARYITLAAVRPLSLVLEREIEKLQDPLCKQAGVCGKGEQSRDKRKLEEFVARLLNNNEPEFFYLEPEIGRGLPEPSCAFLQLSIAVRARDHYQTLLDARTLALSEVFQAKLGWLVGHMYSRVGTPDWLAPPSMTKSQFAKRIDRTLGELVHWVDEEQLNLARDQWPEGATREELRKHIGGVSVPKRKDLVLDAIVGIVQREALLPSHEAPKLRLLLSNDPELATLLKG